ncbi:type I glyceraldehyde-3-phosphate dehydrogenase [Candidatus Peregrinibacteria bacterium CG10_big_fil_rev_8_21_14_0_10_49_24]|nr:MAG: type I glyceraldehyde-3-phosphate dehydrogenase [Candidatus Peregrinibacteria bacterium CG11_big_fil_rev_8_21_14_0_20_49_14]PIR50408.1 MAG: type I glyceraldehyde-3-phosphate dehydrogenase [Candidatus Peregrinibacteria bacterium CG10_big_fil_rev_8_21_14_0_10_49_24]PJA67497.1 MAG: type I glyceraldehyde-3-phosphate dehydrogenase [Candidatus Peregrinibacteria bacterium CG_4_9_14_3_um_filter_49_12]
MNIAINGFGRIGRQALRIIQEKHPSINVVLINDLTDAATLAHLFEFDSTYGHYDCGDTCYKDGMLCNKHGKIRISACKDPSTLAHKELKVDVVLECTGVFNHRDAAAAHLQAGAKKVILSAPCKDKADGTFCLGVNEETYDPKTMDVISNASCTTNCLAPMAKVIHENFGIQQGFMTTIHSYTNDQRLLDLPHKDMRRARAAAINMIPTTTGAAIAVGLVLPELAGKLDGMSIRVPTPTGSLTDLTTVVSKQVTAEEVNAAFKAAAKGSMKGILGYEERPLVLQDYVGDSRSSIIDAQSTKVHTQDGVTVVKTLSWYDNEWGYSNRLVELAELVGKQL